MVFNGVAAGDGFPDGSSLHRAIRKPVRAAGILSQGLLVKHKRRLYKDLCTPIANQAVERIG